MVLVVGSCHIDVYIPKLESAIFFLPWEIRPSNLHQTVPVGTTYQRCALSDGAGGGDMVIVATSEAAVAVCSIYAWGDIVMIAGGIPL